MKRLLVCTAVVFAGSVAAQPTVIDFRGVPLGASEATWKEKIPDIRCQDQRPQFKLLGDRECYASPDVKLGAVAPEYMQFGGVAARSIQADFYDDRLAKITIKLTPGDVSTVVLALTEKFGKPTLIESPMFKTRGGLTETNTITTWKIGTGQIVASRFADAINSASVQYTDAAGLAEFTRRQESMAKAGARTL